MKKIFTFFIITLISIISQAQNKTDISLKWKNSVTQQKSITSETGDLYNELAHHGPAIENEWMALRLYFDKKVSIDVYNKAKTGLELAQTAWYSTPEQQKEGWGADYYKVGNTMGLGGVRLWDGEKVVLLNPVKMRTARVVKHTNISYMEMLSEGIPYKDDTIDVLVRVTVYSGFREAKVEAFALCAKPVQFLTGINYHPSTQTKEGKNYICTWGIHPEDVASFQVAIGAAIVYNPNDFIEIRKEKSEFLMISKPAKYLSTWIISACESEPILKNMAQFISYVENLNIEEY